MDIPKQPTCMNLHTGEFYERIHTILCNVRWVHTCWLLGISIIIAVLSCLGTATNLITSEPQVLRSWYIAFINWWCQREKLLCALPWGPTSQKQLSQSSPSFLLASHGLSCYPMRYKLACSNTHLAPLANSMTSFIPNMHQRFTPKLVPISALWHRVLTTLTSAMHCIYKTGTCCIIMCHYYTIIA